MMNSQDVLRALQAGEISREDAKNKLEENITSISLSTNILDPQQETTGADSSGSTVEFSGRQAEGIAIIGMAGQFPKAKDVEEFWGKLTAGADCISEIPAVRWPIEQYYDEDHTVPGKTYCKWMGVLDDIDKFDPLFFNISPAEAELMDPQQRLFLENSWKCIEDAGISPSSLSENRCGVFVGCAAGDYGKNMREQELSAQSLMGGAGSMLAARISYLLNLKGPCLSIDTACSSSLVAMGEACNSLLLRTSDLALAGGVCVMTGPSMHIMTSKAGMLSKDGRCFAFDTRANGFVPGEGVGVVLLKRLFDAVQDGDQIYGVIRGWGINQDGKTNGITAPSVNSQIRLEKDVYQRFGINPETISLVEAHGTGTKLGDPIEVEALTEAFKAYTAKKNYCALGSAKSNVGHLLTASGITGVIKVLLALQHKMLPPTIHFEKLNEHISLEDSPFYINTALKPWDAPEGMPRRACVSSFGFSGTNAHIVVEEYPGGSIPKKNAIDANQTMLFVLSAKDSTQLKIYAESMKSYVEVHPDLDLRDMSYTLQTGRDAMDFRLAILADSQGQLLERLAGFIHNEAGSGIFTGQVKKDREGVAAFEADEDAQGLIQIWMQKKKLKKVAEVWVKGLNLAWGLLYEGEKPSRISLPTYPFAQERYWIAEVADKNSRTGSIAASQALASIHPLLQKNTSDFSEQRFSSVFTGQEFFLADHIIQGRRVLPGVAYLEMAREAVMRAAGCSDRDAVQISIKNVVWPRPVIVGNVPVKVDIGLYPEENGDIAYEIYSKSEADAAETIVYSQGSAALCPFAQPPKVDLKGVQSQCIQSIPAQQLYEAYGAMGIDYGSGHRGIQLLYAGQDQVLAKISLPASVLATWKQFVLHPSIMDSALQASLGLMLGTGVPVKPALPFALQELEIFGSCLPVMWAVVRLSENHGIAGDKVQKADIDLCDETGSVCVRMQGISSRAVEGTASAGVRETSELLLFKPQWRENAICQSIAEAPDYAQQVIILCEPKSITKEDINEKMQGARCIILQPEQPDIAARFQNYAIQVFEEIRNILTAKPKGKVLVQIVVSSKDEQQLFMGLSGILKTAQLENPTIAGQFITLDCWDEQEIIGILQENSKVTHDSVIRYQAGKRCVLGWQEASDKTSNIPWKNQGVYLITGGAGDLGLIFAKEIASKVTDAVLVLTGRSLLSAAKEKKVKELMDLGARVEYKQVDVTQRQAVEDLVRGIAGQYGSLDGIIHSAGVIQDNFIIRKTTKEFLAVMAPKVSGLVNLDYATEKMGLDFFIFFSSMAGTIGNAGQADYAAANAFMDAFAEYRNALVSAKQRYGQTISINWPLWKNGGMRVDEETEKTLMQGIGMQAMQTANGIRAFYQSLAAGQAQVMVMEGDSKRLRAALLQQSSASLLHCDVESKEVPILGQDILREKVTEYLKTVLSSVSKLPAQRIEADAPLEKYGIDSVMVMQLTNQLEKTFGSLPKTLFFEYQSLQDLTEYFLETYGGQLTELLGLAANKADKNPKEGGNLIEPVDIKQNSHRHSRFLAIPSESGKGGKQGLEIAIIGLSGRYPGAKNIQEFWNVLQEGKDCITEIPKERWDYSLYFDQDKSKAGKTYSKWGGFLAGVDLFDPLFFNISPREASMMDPQERLFLQCVFETLEDSGYTRQDLDREGNVGVYVGVMSEEYQLYGAQKQAVGEGVAFPGNPSSIANRVSYFCNFHGPSMAIDTMCSSSLTAIHLACQSLQQGSCGIAIAGGVNVSIHPNKYLLLGQGKFLSSQGRCESFGKGGDGYVPGEGVGAILLKPLSKAVEDGDHIYGIIKATAINHGGKTNGYTVPNPNAQASVVNEAYAKAGINPRTVSYIEAHGTGTSLGDPIEIAGLNKTFQQYTTDKQFCAIGTVKSNIGHCESAAGIAGITKVLLQLKYRRLVPSLHSKTLNPNIDFSSSPFKVQQEVEEWKRPIIKSNGETKEYPRIAGVSAFGAGGSNAHIVIEEYIPDKLEQQQIVTDEQNPAIIVLSAKSEKQLYEQARRLRAAIEGQEFTNDSLVNIAYTLQSGREPMEERLALTAVSLQELKAKLDGFMKGQEGIADLYRGQVKRHKEMLTIFKADEELREAVDKWIARKKYAKLLELWVKGLIFDWRKLYDNTNPFRISLPTYPFSEKRYWVPETGNKPASNATVSQTGADMEYYLLQPITKIKSSFSKPEKISLQSVLDQPSFSSKPVSQIQQTVTLSSTREPLVQTENNEKIQLNHVQATVAPERLQEELTASLANAVGMEPGDIDVDTDFVEMGLDSIIGVEWIRAINEQYGTSIMAIKVYDYPNIREFTQFLVKELSQQGKEKQQEVSAINQSAAVGLQPIELPPKEATTVLKQSALEENEEQGYSEPVSAEKLQEGLLASLAKALCIEPSDMDIDTSFVDMGLDSIIGVEWVRAINEQYGTSIMAIKVYDYPSIRQFAGFLESELKKRREGLNLIPLQASAASSLRGLIQQVQQGNLDIEQADQQIHQLYK